MLLRLGSVLLLGLSLLTGLRADEPLGPALALFDAYLAEAARTVTAYRTDVRIGDDPKHSDEGRLAGESAFLGRFTYRPITYTELSRAERALLVHDPQFHLFLASRVRPAAASPAQPQPPPPTAIDFHFAIPPDEMLRSRPFVIVLPR